jgi:hypothetical protein
MFYFDFGGVAEILESASLLNKHILTQGARFVASIETFSTKKITTFLAKKIICFSFFSTNG